MKRNAFLAPSLSPLISREEAAREIGLVEREGGRRQKGTPKTCFFFSRATLLPSALGPVHHAQVQDPHGAIQAVFTALREVR